MMPRPPRPSSQILREEGDLKRRQLSRERLLRATLAALAAAAAVLLSSAPLPAALPFSASSSAPLSSRVSASLSAAEHRGSSIPLPPSFGKGAEGYFPRGCVWRSTPRREGERATSSSSDSDGNREGSDSSSSPSSLEFYLEETESWTLEMPSTCTIAGDHKVRGGGRGEEEEDEKEKRKKKRRKTKETSAAAEENAPSFPFSPLSSTSQSCDTLACTYRGGLWLSGRGRWHSIIESGGSGSGSGSGSVAAVKGKISRNLRLAPLRVSGSAAAFASAVAGSSSNSQLRLAAGRTLVVDFGFYRHPSAIGHWAEVAGQLASHVFSSETRGRENENVGGENGGDENDDEKRRRRRKRKRKGPLHRFDRVVLLHVSRAHFGEWARAALAAALSVEPGGSLPPVYFQRGVEALSDLRPPPPPSSSSTSFSSSFASLRPPPTIEESEAPMRARLESLSIGSWIAFEEVVIVRDTATGGQRFAVPAAAAREWRRRFFALHGLTIPEEEEEEEQEKAPKKTILYLRKREDRRVLNEAALLESLRRSSPSLGARVLAADFSKRTAPSSSLLSPVPVRDQLLLLSRADVLLSAHTSALAGALFLRQKRKRRRRREGESGDEEKEKEKGAAVVELLQANWGGWGALDESFRALTSSFDDEGEEGDEGRIKALRHGSWRAAQRQQGAYPGRRDGERFGGWIGGNGDGKKERRKKLSCASEACVEAHTRVDLVVDVSAVTELVRKALEGKEVEWGVESSGE